MHLKSIELSGFKSFATKSKLEFKTPISAIVGPNGSGKSNIAEAFRFVLGEQSIKSMRGKKGEDLIFNGSRNSPKSNRADVKMIFDNKKRLLDVDYDEVIIERIVFRDGINQYLINGTQVRLKDIMELLASANIGSTGHHIISQGEADKILNVNSKDRKSMIEDALGLKIYHYKKRESVRKLEKTQQNIKEVEGLRKEIKPHIKFLEKQVKKVEKTHDLKEKLECIYGEYLKRERIYLDFERKKLNQEKINPQKEYDELNKELKESEKNLSKKKDESINAKELIEIKNLLEKNQKEKSILEREIGKIEGEMFFNEKNLARSRNNVDKSDFIKIPKSNLEEFSDLMDKYTLDIERTNEVSVLKNILISIKTAISNLILIYKKRNADETKVEENLQVEIERLIREKNNLEIKIVTNKKEWLELSEKHSTLQKKIDSEKDFHRDIEKRIFQNIAKINEIKILLNNLESRENKLFSDEINFKNEFSEAIVLIGNDISGFLNYKIVDENGMPLSEEYLANEDRVKQEERKKELEKNKIRLEDIGVGSSEEVIKEYNEVKERDEFLEREIEDLRKSKESIDILIKELEEKLDIEFKDGIKKINEQLSKFFVSMFGGGTANITVVKNIKKKLNKGEFDSDENIEILEQEINEEEIIEEGIDINITLPHKRIKGLEMLSGGERALTSIALTFAISQIKPPPFIVLDETDAALDESNSKKYGNIIEDLSKYSQLILITHNRETMSRAGVLYGITMNSDGISKMLSVEFEEAVKIAK